jgi:hypothetical protein
MNLISSSASAGAWRRSLAVGLLLTLLPLGFITGCQSAATGGSHSFASVIIENHTMDEIREVAIAVFSENFYTTKVSGPDILVFEKAGSTMDNVLYGGWGPDVTLRVKLYISSASSLSYQLTAQAYMVREAGDIRIEDEQRMTKLRRGPYQKLLEQIKARLEAASADQKDGGA